MSDQIWQSVIIATPPTLVALFGIAQGWRASVKAKAAEAKADKAEASLGRIEVHINGFVRRILDEKDAHSIVEAALALQKGLAIGRAENKNE